MNNKDLFTILVASDVHQNSDVVVLLEGDGFSRINKSCSILINQEAKFLIFSGGVDNEEVGSFCYNKCESRILNYNVPQVQLVLELNSTNTREQALEVIEMCVQNNWTSLILTASHYHQFRAFLTFLKVLIEKKIENKIIIYNAPENQLDWFADSGWGKRVDLLELEFDKIQKYQKLGHIASYSDAVKYFKWREKNIKI